jgi:biotin operon repressor
MKNEIRTLIENSNGRRWTRSQLMVAVNRSDRYVRETIHALRREGCRIVSDTDEGGYWLGTPDEWNEFCDQQRRRALNNFYQKTYEDARQLVIV